MAHVISAAHAHARDSLTARISRFAGNVLVAWAQHREFQRTFNELDALSDHELSDIGVRRSDIADIARQHVYGN